MRFVSRLAMFGSAVVAVGVASVALATPGDLPQTPVLLTNPSFEADAAASGGYLVWSQSPKTAPMISNVWLRTPAASTRINVAGTKAYSGGIDGRLIVYQQVSNGQSDLRLYNAVTKHRSHPPRGFNTSDWEFGPTISGEWILFGRASVPQQRHQQVILRNRVTGKQVILDDLVTTPTTVFSTYLLPGQVNGGWAVWLRCVRNRCNVFRFDIATRTAHKLVNTLPGQIIYAPSVSTSGTAYFAESSAGCGHSVKLMQHLIGQTPTVLVHFKPGYDLYNRTFGDRKSNERHGYLFHEGALRHR